MDDGAIAGFLERVKKDRVRLVKIDWMGFDLVLRCMGTSTEFLEDAVRNGIGVTQAQQSFNVLDRLAPDGMFGAQSSEFKLIPDLDTYAALPHLPGVGRMQAELCNPDDLSPTITDPRYFLRRMISVLDKKGYRVSCSFEPEFFLYRQDRTPFVNGKLMSSQSMDELSTFLLDVHEVLTRMGVRVEHFKKEYGSSQVEITMNYAGALRAADDMVLLKSVIKSIASSRSLVASFMPKVNNGSAGSGMHVHISLSFADGSGNAFHAADDRRGLGLSGTAYAFIGGLMEHMSALCAFANPLSNSYKRLVPGSWAPAHISYGYDHRGTAIRIPSVPPGSTAAKRIEFRLPDCSANPYIVLGAVLAAGVHGMESDTVPCDPMTKDPSSMSTEALQREGVKSLPSSLIESILAAEKDSILRERMGEAFYDEYLKVRRSEWTAYARNVDDWEVENFLEFI